MSCVKKCAPVDVVRTMAKPDETKPGGRRTVSPPTGMKRDRLDDDAAPARVVSQRTEEVPDVESTITEIILEKFLSNDETTLKKAMSDLCDYLSLGTDLIHCYENADAIFQAGGHLAVVRIVNQSLNHTEILSNGIRVLARFAYKSKERKSAVAAVQGIQAIFASMQQFASDPGVTLRGITALGNLVEDHESNANLAVTKHACAPFVVKQMRNFAKHEGIILTSCFLLSELGSFDELRDAIVEAKAVSAIGAAIENHPKHVHIQCHAWNALKLLIPDMECLSFQRCRLDVWWS